MFYSSATLINVTVEGYTAAETVRVVKYEDTFPSVYVPQSYLHNYNLFKYSWKLNSPSHSPWSRRRRWPPG